MQITYTLIFFYIETFCCMYVIFTSAHNGTHKKFSFKNVFLYWSQYSKFKNITNLYCSYFIIPRNLEPNRECRRFYQNQDGQFYGG